MRAVLIWAHGLVADRGRPDGIPAPLLSRTIASSEEPSATSKSFEVLAGRPCCGATALIPSSGAVSGILSRALAVCAAPDVEDRRLRYVIWLNSSHGDFQLGWTYCYWGKLSDAWCVGC